MGRLKKADVREYFFHYTDVRGEDECWPWTGLRNRTGYGQLKGTKYRGRLSHCISWIIHNGPLPEGMRVLHRCDNPPCCNPKHLFIGTQADNVADMVAKGRNTHQGRGDKYKYVCPNGHERTIENTYFYPRSNQIACLVCRKAWWAKKRKEVAA
jgi:hypothetical protein